MPVFRSWPSTTSLQYLKPTIVSPIQTRYLKLLHKADELFMLINTLMLHGEMAEREHSKRELQIKHHMRTVPSTVRKITLGLRQRVTAQQEGCAETGCGRAEGRGQS